MRKLLAGIGLVLCFACVAVLYLINYAYNLLRGKKPLSINRWIVVDVLIDLGVYIINILEK